MSIGRENKVQYIMFYNHVCTEEEEEDVSVDGISLGSPSVVITGRQQRSEREEKGLGECILLLLCCGADIT